MNNNKGFTLIELMIVVAIVGILSAIAIPLYQTHIARTKITAAVSELNGAKTQYELIVNDASSSGNNAFTVDNMFFAGIESDVCIYAVNAPDNTGNSDEALSCQLQNVNPEILGEFIYLERSSQGTWRCRTSAGVSNSYKPANCI